MTANIEMLTEKEKQTLRLIVRGHDAKSIARHLDLSVHTINERLRDARRKMSVSSSREAARQLLDREGHTPDSVADERIGEAATQDQVQGDAAPDNGEGRKRRLAWIIAGGAIMSLVFGFLALTALPQLALAPAGNAPAATAAESVRDAAIEAAALDFLVLIDQKLWADSYKATAKSFQKLNTLKVWADVSEQAHAPLGAMMSRTMTSHENLPAPPHGYEVVKFRTSYANKADVVETVTLDREGQNWRVVGIMIG